MSPAIASKLGFALLTHLLIDSSTSLLEQKKPGFPGFFCFSSVYDDQAANNAFIFFSALASIWRIRSAETPYSSAKS